MKAEVVVLGSPALTVRKKKTMVSVDVKQHSTQALRAQELCESRGSRPGLPVLNSPYGVCDIKQHGT